jgi:hypothetical protein
VGRLAVACLIGVAGAAAVTAAARHMIFAPLRHPALCKFNRDEWRRRANLDRMAMALDVDEYHVPPGMTVEDVYELLGWPHHIDRSGQWSYRTSWTTGLVVQFNDHQRVRWVAICFDCYGGNLPWPTDAQISAMAERENDTMAGTGGRLRER